MTQHLRMRDLFRLAFHFRHRFHTPGPDGLDTEYCIAVPGCLRRRP